MPWACSPAVRCSTPPCSPELTRIHADDWTWIWYFDSAGVIQTQGFNLFAHTADFVLVLMLLRYFKLPEWGFPEGTNSDAQLAVVQGLRLPTAEAPTLQGPTSGTRSRRQQADEHLLSATFTVDGTGEDNACKRMLVDPTRIIYKRSPELRGRRTTVYDAEDPADGGVCYVAKWSYPQVTRENEARTVWVARDIVRQDKRALEALPDVVAFKDYADLSTDTVRMHLHPYEDPAESLVKTEPHAKKHGERILRCIFERKLEPLTYLNDLWFVRGMNECIRCMCLL